MTYMYMYCNYPEYEYNVHVHVHESYFTNAPETINAYEMKNITC